MEKYTNASAATWARTICLIVALLNSLLASFNKSPLPIDNEQLQQLVSTLITVGEQRQEVIKMEPEVEFCWDDILADDVGLIEEYPVDCLLAVFTGYFLFYFASE